MRRRDSPTVAGARLFLPPLAAAMAAIVPPTTTAAPTPMPTFARVERFCRQMTVPGYGVVKSVGCSLVTITSAHRVAWSSVLSVRRAWVGLRLLLNHPWKHPTAAGILATAVASSFRRSAGQLAQGWLPALRMNAFNWISVAATQCD